MKLLLDVGNTRCKWALADGGGLVRPTAIIRAEQADWLDRLPWHDADTVFVSSVAAPEVLADLAARAREAGLAMHEVASEAQSGRLVNGYRQPGQLGVDRWLACIAAEANGSGSVLVADAGTALTLDFVDAQSRHRGGTITTGVATMRAALRSRTQLRPGAETAFAWLNTDTDDAIAAGTRRSAVCMLDAAAEALAPERLILTGGDAPALADRLQRPWQIRPQLVLEGLVLYAARVTG